MSDIRTAEALEKMLGEQGFTYIDDVAKVEGKYIAIQVLDDAVVTTEGEGYELEAVAIGEGQVIVGKFTSIQLAMGSILAYKG